jgi:hypothetical protein
MRYLAGVAMATLIALGGTANATEFVVNGTFTNLTNGLGQIDGHQTTAVGWSTPTNGYNFVFSNGNSSVNGQYGGLKLWTNATSGNGWDGNAAGAGYFLAMDGAFQTQAVSQTIQGLTVGHQYTLSFDYGFGQQYGFNSATVQSLSASFGDQQNGFQNFSSGGVDVANHGFVGWTHVTESVTANSTSEVLSFLANGNQPVPPFALVSNVSLTGELGAPAPSPAGPVALLGLLALYGAKRRSARG